MSNTLNTPIEALELEFPLRVVEYSLRRGSGGAGRYRGGDGVIRELEALAPLHYSLITERRRHAPPGAAGGEPGAPGATCSTARELPPRRRGELAPGQRLRIETPGGGGYGKPRSSADERARRVPRPRDHGLADGGEPGPRGFELTVWNRTAATAERFAAEHRRRRSRRRPPRPPREARS